MKVKYKTTEAFPADDSLDGQWFDILKTQGLCGETYQKFREIIYGYYAQQRRAFDWRETISPYRIFISEVMLQQTQTVRVAEKFGPFIKAFPDFTSLYHVSFGEVLRLWKGLGYNRRAKYLQDAAGIIVEEYGGELPEDPELLVTLPGIGPATAASISVFAFNHPWPFIETNIRTVYIHFFFPGEEKVTDAKIIGLVEHTLDQASPREWYYALMDYGVMLKKTIGNLSRRSKHYSKQAPFVGSDRQLRGKILQLLLDQATVHDCDLAELLSEPQERCLRVLESLCREAIVRNNNGNLSLA